MAPPAEKVDAEAGVVGGGEKDGKKTEGGEGSKVVEKVRDSWAVPTGGGAHVSSYFPQGGYESVVSVRVAVAGVSDTSLPGESRTQTRL